METMAKEAKKASFEMAKASLKQKNGALEALIQNLKKYEGSIFEANQKDIALAKEKGLSLALIDRLSLENRLDGIIQDITQVILLPDPVGDLFEAQELPNQLHLAKCRTPLGVLGVIYESRPNVTLDISALSIKSGNCAILRGGSETLNTNKVLIQIVQSSLSFVGLPLNAIQLITNTDRNEVKELLQMYEYIDLIIPRGSAALQEFCREHSTIPVVTGGVGICHLFVDESADVNRSLNVIVNAKTQRPTVCNALDTILVHSSIATVFVPKVVAKLKNFGVCFRLDPKSFALVQDSSCFLAEIQDWSTEWLSLVLGIKVVENLDEAIDHIHVHSTGHSDGILTGCTDNAERFVKEIDSAAVYVNASTRFTDGAQFGLGSEVAISTQKLHARGPMGLKELTSYKWVVRGDYQLRI